MINIEKMTKKFSSNIVFDSFDMKIDDGEFVILSGDSGCGKTTLINIIGGIEPIDSGKISVNNYELSGKYDRTDFFRNCIGFLFQNYGLVDNKTVKQNIEIVKKSSRSGLFLEEVLKKVGMENTEDRIVHSLSGGEQQRIAIARLLYKKCSIILADEPTGSLDKKNTQIVMELLKDLNKNQKKTIVMVTHDETLLNEADRVIKIKSAAQSKEE